MGLSAGTHKLGPNNATLRVKTTREGMAQSMGHDLVIEVGSWDATIEAAEDPSETTVQLNADGGSLQIKGASGGGNVSDGDKKKIKKSMDDKVLKGGAIEFKSTSVEGSGDTLNVSGDLKIGGSSGSVSFPLDTSGGKVSGSTSLTQSSFGIKPFVGMMGALKVGDKVEVEVEGTPE